MTRQQLERTLRRVRQRIFDYDDEKQKKASRLITKLKMKLGEYWHGDMTLRHNMKLNRTPSSFEPGCR